MNLRSWFNRGRATPPVELPPEVPWDEPVEEAPEETEPDAPPEPIVIPVPAPSANLIALSRQQGWTMYRCKETGAILRGQRCAGKGRIHSQGGLQEFSAGDYQVKPIGGGVLRIIPKSQFEARFEEWSE